jgi:hypothetical protein
MELQEPTLKAAITEVRFKPTPHFALARPDLIEDLQSIGELPDWGMNEQLIQVFAEGDPETVLQVSAGNMSTSFENTDADVCKAITGRAIEATIARLGIEAATYIGVRSIWLAAADDFDELHTWLVDTLGGQSLSVLEPVGQKPSDSGWVFEFRSSVPEHLLRIGPMKQEQATAQIFRDKAAENYPPQFLFLDLDRQYGAEATPGPEILDRWGKSFDRCLEVAEQIVDRLRSLV